MDRPPGGEPPPPPREGAPLVQGFASSFQRLFGGIWALIGTVLFVALTAAGGPVWDDWILDSRGVTATAVPVRIESTGVRVNRVRMYDVVYRYREPSGLSREGTVRVPGGRSGSFEIEYDPKSPSRVRVKGQKASVFGLGILIPLAFLVVGWVIYLRGVRARRREVALYRNGTATAAKVRAVEATGARVNRRPAYKVDLVFHTPDGAVLTSTTTFDPPAPKDTIWVIYDPAEPEHVMIA